MTVSEIERSFYLKNTPLPEYLVEMADAGETFMEITSTGDIDAGFPKEDFLDEVIQDLEEIIEGMHGNNKALPSLKDLIEKIRQVGITTMQSAEYGASELRALQDKLGV